MKTKIGKRAGFGTLPAKVYRPKPVPSPTQLEALRRIVADPQAIIQRERGGFWVTPAIAGRVIAMDRGRFHCREVIAWEWYAPTKTVVALERRGWVERTYTYQEGWRDTRRITAAGLAIAKEGKS